MSKKRWKRQKYTTDGSDSISFQFSTGDVWRVRGGNKTFQTDCLLLLPPRPSRTTFHLQIYSLTLMAITAKASRQTGQFQQNAIDSPLLYLFLVATTKVSKTKLVILNRKSKFSRRRRLSSKWGGETTFPLPKESRRRRPKKKGREKVSGRWRPVIDNSWRESGNKDKLRY